MEIIFLAYPDKPDNADKIFPDNADKFLAFSE